MGRYVLYETDRNLGQWAPIVGTALALLGSFYMVLAEAMDQEAVRRMHDLRLTNGVRAESNAETQSLADDCSESRGGQWTNMLRPLASLLLTLSNYVGNPANKRYDDSSFQMGQANAFPETPGERGRVRELDQIQTDYAMWRDITPAAGSVRSRAGSSVSKEGVEHIEGSPQQRASSRHRRDTGDTLKPPSPTRNRAQITCFAPPRKITTTIASGSQNMPAIVVSPVEMPPSPVGESASGPSDVPSMLPGG